MIRRRLPRVADCTRFDYVIRTVDYGNKGLLFEVTVRVLHVTLLYRYFLSTRAQLYLMRVSVITHVNTRVEFALVLPLVKEHAILCCVSFVLIR